MQGKGRMGRSEGRGDGKEGTREQENMEEARGKTESREGKWRRERRGE
jgi:hypothetical protein